MFPTLLLTNKMYVAPLHPLLDVINDFTHQFGRSFTVFFRPPYLKPAPTRAGMNRASRRRKGHFFEERWEDRPEPKSALYIVDRVIPSAALTVLYGESGVGKTEVVMQLANAVANGHNFHGRRTTRTGVIYFDYEMGEAQLGLYGQRLGLQGYISPQHDVPLSEIEALIRQAAADGGGLAIIDSYSSLANQTGYENAVNSNSVAERILKPLADLAHTLDIAIVILHHTNKGNVVYDGSQRIKGMSDMLLKLSLDRSSSQMRLMADKTRFEFQGLEWDASGHPNLQGRSATQEEGEDHDGQLDWLLDQLGAGPAFTDDLKVAFRAEFNQHEKTLERAIARGVESEQLVKEKVGRKNRLQLPELGHLQA